MTKLTPAEVDVQAAKYCCLQSALDEAIDTAKLRCLPLAQLKQELIGLVRDFGTKSETSFLLRGVTAEMTVAFTSAVSYDPTAVERFRLALLEEERERLAGLVFKQKWELKPEAAEIIAGAKLAKPLRALFAACEVVKPNAPTLVVRTAPSRAKSA
jgi:hypothetical protein